MEAHGWRGWVDTVGFAWNQWVNDFPALPLDWDLQNVLEGGERVRFWPAHLEPRLWMAGKAPLRPNQLQTGLLVPKPVIGWGSDPQISY